MAKVVVPITNTSFDANVDENKVLQNLGVAPKVLNPQTRFTEDSGNNNDFSNIDLSKQPVHQSLYDNDVQAQNFIAEKDAQNQSALELIGKFTGNVAVTIGREILKTPGYLIGGGAAIAAKLDPNEKPGEAMEWMTDNAYLNFFDNLSEDVKSLFPVQVQKDVQEGGITRKLMSGEWWATTGADGLGFMLAMMAPGQALKAAGVGSTIAKGMEGMNMLGKTAESLGLAEEINGAYKATTKLINSANSVAAAALNTYTEAASEAGNSFDNVKTKLKAEHPELSDDEIRAKAGEAAANVFKANLGVLMVSNIIDEAWLWKGFKGADNVSKESLITKLFKDGKLVNSIENKSYKQLLKDTGLAIAENTAKEGLYEEGMQFRIQQDYEKQSEDGTEANILSPSKYFEQLFNSTEMQESVVLGGILGGGMSTVNIVSDNKRENRALNGQAAFTPNVVQKFFGMKPRTETKGLRSLFDDNMINRFRSIDDVVIKDDKGNIQRDADGKIKLDAVKLKELSEEKQRQIALNIEHDLAIASGNNTYASAIANINTFNYMLPFLREEGGYDVLKEHIQNQMVDKWASQFQQNTGKEATQEQKDVFKNDALEKAKTYNDVYQKVRNTHNPEMFVKNDSEHYTDWSQDVFNRKLQLLLNDKHNYDYRKALNEHLLKHGISYDDFKSKEINKTNFPNVSINDLATLQQQKLQEKELVKSEELVASTFDKLFNKKGLQKDYDDFIKSRKDDKEQIENAVENAVQKDKDDEFDNASEESFLAQAKEQGYDIVKVDKQYHDAGYRGFFNRPGVDNIVIEDKNGNRDVLGYTRGHVVTSNRTKDNFGYFRRANKGKIVQVVDENGNFTKEFLRQGWKVVSKQQLEAEKRIVQLQNYRKVQIETFEKTIKERTEELKTAKLEHELLVKQANALTEQLKNLQSEFNTYTSKIGDRVFKHPNKSKILLKKKQLEELLLSTEIMLEALEEKKAFYEKRIIALQGIIRENQLFSDRLKQTKNEFISFTKIKGLIQEQLNKAIDNLETDVLTTNDIVKLEAALNEHTELRNELWKHIQALTKLKTTLEDTFNKNEVFINYAMLSDIEKKQKVQEMFNEKAKLFLANVESLFKPTGGKWLRADLEDDYNQLFDGDSLFRNNLTTRAESLAEYYRQNLNELWENAPQFVIQLFKKNNLEMGTYNNMMSNFPSFSTSDIYSYLRQNALDVEDLIEKEIRAGSKLSVEQAFNLKNNLDITFKELQNLQKSFDNITKELVVLQLQQRLLILDEKFQQQVVSDFQNRVNQLNEESELDSSQVQPKIIESEPKEADVETLDKFFEHSLPLHTFFTSGLNIEYDRNTKKDVLNAEGIPVIVDNNIQKTWFATLDQIARRKDTDNYMLKTVHAKYDDSDEFQKIIAVNNPLKENRSENDFFTFLVDKQGNPVRADETGNLKPDGLLVFSALKKPESIFTEQGVKLAMNNVVESYLQSVGVNQVFKVETTTDSKSIDEMFKNKDTVKFFNDNNIKTFGDIKTTAVENAKQDYIKFLNSIRNKSVYLPIVRITKGKPVYKRKDGKRAQNKITDTFKTVVVQDGLGPDKLQGGKLILARDKTVIRDGNNSVQTKPGTVYLQTDDGNHVALEARTLNDSEIKAVMLMLSMSFGQQLNTLVAKAPLKKNGEQYYYEVNGMKLSNNIPIFFRKNIVGQKSLMNFSLINTLINYGYRSKDEQTKTPIDSKGQLYIVNGIVKYITFNGEAKTVSVEDIHNAIKENKWNSYNTSVKEFFEFLQTKRINVNAELLSKNPVFLKPKVAYDAKGNATLELDKSQTYYKFLLEDALTTPATAVKGYPLFVQRNIEFGTKPVEIKKEETIKKEIKTEVKEKVEINDALQGVLDRTKANILKYSREEAEAKLKTLNKAEMFNKFISAKQDDAPANYEEQVKKLIDDIFKAYEDHINSFTKTENKVESDNTKSTFKLETVLPARRSIGNKTLSTDTSLKENKTVDKVYSPEEMLVKLIQQNQIKQECQ